MKDVIRQTLEELSFNNDDLLVEYIEIMITNGKQKDEIQSELSTLLNSDSNVEQLAQLLFGRVLNQVEGQHVKTSGVGKTDSERNDTLFTETSTRLDRVKKMTKCQLWPECPDENDCEFMHPTELCKYYPNCSFGGNCIYIHPPPKPIPCRFGFRCSNLNCIYQHPSGPIHNRSSRNIRMNANAVPRKPLVKDVLCVDFPECANEECPYLHPVDRDCKFGDFCTRSGCKFKHPLTRKLPDPNPARDFSEIPCKFQPHCTRPSCPYMHDESKHISERVYTANETAIHISNILTDDETGSEDEAGLFAEHVTQHILAE